ncbi:MAG: response regulator [Sandaracinaceae bacterium]|nr:response regulator [Sandaracinaceae bacterium]
MTDGFHRLHPEVHARPTTPTLKSMAARDLLLVDDDALMVRLLSRYLGSRGWTVRGFTRSADALASALERAPTVVLTDLEMPGVAGDALARALREQLGERSPQLVLITASHVVPREVEALFDAVIQKPFRLERVASILRELDAPARDAGSHVRLKRPREDVDRETGSG